MKNNSCLFERPFEIQKNGVFLFEISVFVSEILTFFFEPTEMSLARRIQKDSQSKPRGMNCRLLRRTRADNFERKKYIHTVKKSLKVKNFNKNIRFGQ